MIHYEKRKKSVKSDTEITQMIELVDKDVKTVIIIVFHMFKKAGET